MLNWILFIVAGVVLVFYIARRRARLRAEDGDKK